MRESQTHVDFCGERAVTLDKSSGVGGYGHNLNDLYYRGTKENYIQRKEKCIKPRRHTHKQNASTHHEILVNELKNAFETCVILPVLSITDALRHAHTHRR